MRMPTSLPFASVTGTPRDLVLLHDLQRLGDRLPRAHGHGVDDHPRLGALHLVDFLGLPVDGHVLVDHADAAVLGHGDGQPRLGDGVHGRGDDGDVQADVAGEARGDVDEVRMEVGAGGLEQDVVEREGRAGSARRSARRAAAPGVRPRETRPGRSPEHPSNTRSSLMSASGFEYRTGAPCTGIARAFRRERSRGDDAVHDGGAASDGHGRPPGRRVRTTCRFHTFDAETVDDAVRLYIEETTRSSSATSSSSPASRPWPRSAKRPACTRCSSRRRASRFQRSCGG